jgi:hypothetical protein
MEENPPARETGMEADEAGSKARMESAKTAMEASEASMEAKDGLAEHSAITNATSVAAIAFEIGLPMFPPPKIRAGSAIVLLEPTPCEGRG